MEECFEQLGRYDPSGGTPFSTDSCDVWNHLFVQIKNHAFNGIFHGVRGTVWQLLAMPKSRDPALFQVIIQYVIITYS